MKVLYVASYYKPALAYGGPVRSVSELCEGLVKVGTEVTVFTTNANGRSRVDVALHQPLNVNGVRVFYFPVILDGSFFWSPTLRSAVLRRVQEFDLVVLESLYTHAMGPAVSACCYAHVPYIVPLRGQLLPWALRHKFLKKRLYFALVGRRYLNKAAALYCTDETEAEAVSKLKLRSPVFVVPNGLDAMRFTHLPERGHLLKRLGIPPQARVLLFLGRLHHMKRPDIAIDTLARAGLLPNEVHLVVSGPDEQRMALMLQAQARSLGCANRLHMTGVLSEEETLQAFSDADLLLMPSEFQESFGMSALEAMAAGVPILVSEGVPVGRWAEKVGAGRMVPCQAEAFAQATNELLSNIDRLREMGERGRALAKERFDFTFIARQMLGHLDSIVTNGYPLSDFARDIEYTQESV